VGPVERVFNRPGPGLTPRPARPAADPGTRQVRHHTSRQANRSHLSQGRDADCGPAGPATTHRAGVADPWAADLRRATRTAVQFPEARTTFGRSVRCRPSCDRQASRPVARQLADMCRGSAGRSQLWCCSPIGCSAQRRSQVGWVGEGMYWPGWLNRPENSPGSGKARVTAAVRLETSSLR
jgi:hypothetical protein